MKKTSKHKLKCVLTGKIRQSNQFYIKKRADKSGVTEELFRSYYATKSALIQLKKELSESSWDAVRDQYKLTTQELVYVLKVNGRGAQLDQFRSVTSSTSTSDEVTSSTSTNDQVVDDVSVTSVVTTA